MDLRAKLERFRRVNSAPRQAPEPLEEAGSSPRPEIQALRARLQEVMARSAAREVEKRERQREEIEARLRAAPLPFDEQETDLGPLHVRSVRHPGHERVGRVPIARARTTPGELLALLSLDTSLREVDAARALYLDTEATGLAGGTGTVPFLIGLAWFEQDELVVEQLLLRRLGEEGPMLARMASHMSRASMLVSFNGKAFDMPLLRTRFVMNRLRIPQELPHLDLVHVARRVHRTARSGRERPGGPGHPGHGPFIEAVDEQGEHLRRTSCKLVALEQQILGFGRVDDVPSSEVPARYGHFLRTGDADAIRSVCDHNLWDVVSMAALLTVYASAIEALDEADRSLEPSRESTQAAPLGGRDLVGLATTLERAGDLRRARRAADAAVSASIVSEEVTDDELHALARKARGKIAVRAKDVATAVDDFEHLSAVQDDRGARLSLAKLYEHRLKDPERALSHVERGTSEKETESEHRKARLLRKAARAPKGQKRRA